MHGRTIVIPITAVFGSIVFASPAPQVGELANAAPPSFPPTFRYNKDETNYRKLPKRSQLPVVEGNPVGSAWLWGKDDDIGRLNFLTPERVRRGVAEIVTGEVVPLNVGVFSIDPPLFSRQKFNLTFEQNQFGGGTLPLFDEIVEMNTQTASQIDGFRHFGHLASKLFYNGCTIQDVIGPSPTLRCGIQEFAKHGIVGRAIFLDVGAYREKNGFNWPLLDYHNITLSTLKKVAAGQGIDLRRNSEGGDIQIGDLFIIRTGFLKEYLKLTPAEKAAYATRPDPNAGWTGLEAAPNMLDFIHDSYFPGVFADNPSMEAWPLPPNGISFHESMLSFWGSAIGEFWDLERLSEKCKKNRKWTFLVTSAPFNIDGGIASWANAIAIL